LLIHADGPPVKASSTGRLAFLFALGHGHYAQFLNFREAFPREEAHRAEWIGLGYDSSPDLLANSPLLPRSFRLRRHQLWHAQDGLSRHSDWQALFVAGHQLSFLPMMRRYPTYLYVDYSPSIVRDFAPYFGVPLKQRPVVQAAKLFAQRVIFRASRGVFCMSTWAAAGVRQDYRVDPRRIHVTLPGANLKRWQFVDRRHRPTDAPVRILMVGGEFERKGGHLLLHWADKTQATGWQMDLVTWPGQFPAWVDALLESPGPNQLVSRSLAPRLPQVRVHCGVKANSPELMQLFSDADIFCLPTLADASSIATLEAMATGLPVIVSASGGIPELVLDMETGMLVRPRSVTDLSVALEQLVAERTLRLAIGDAARRSCERFFNIERQLREILSVIDHDTRPIGVRDV
jgi:glycosyltransferase involved in cell wall biosynthesis